MRPLLLSALTFCSAAVASSEAGAGCPSNSTVEPGFARRSCIAKIVNSVASASACQSLCCADAAKTLPNDGCNAWFINDYNQCFMCSGKGDSQPPPAVKADKNQGCRVPPAATNCSTGLVTPPPPPPLPPAPTKGPLGGEASAQYVDYARGMRWPSHLNGTQLDRSLLSPEGWPLTDCVIVMFDSRPVGAWAPPMDDPEKRQADLSGDWTLSLKGKAKVSLSDPAIKGITLGAATYDASSNTQTQTLTIAKGKYPDVVNLVVLKFENTQQDASADQGSGFRDLRLVMPGFAGKQQLFSDNWAALMKPFDHLRWMGTTGTNSYSWRCGGENAGGCSVIRWEDRALPSYAFLDKNLCPGCLGTPWEHVPSPLNSLEHWSVCTGILYCFGCFPR